VIAAGSVVRGEVEAFAIYAGAPAKRIGERGR
jgi:virginiamycin A acetyltransferase